MNADVFLEEKLIDYILSQKDSPVMFADSSRKEEADYKFKFENGVLLKYGKELEETTFQVNMLELEDLVKTF